MAVATIAPEASTYLALGEADAGADADDAAGGGQQARRRADGLEVGDLDLDRGVALPGRQGGVQGAAEGGVEQGADDAAVDRADRVEHRLVRRQREHRLAGRHRDQRHAEQRRDRRAGHLAVDHRLQEGQALGPAAGHRGGHRVVPGDGLAPDGYVGRRHAVSSGSEVRGAQRRHFRSGSAGETACARPQASSASSTGSRSRPDDVRWYSYRGGPALVLALLQHPGLHQRGQPGGDPVPRGAGAGDDLVEPPGAEADLADDQQGPPLADDLERRGDRAGPSREVGEGDETYVSLWCGGHGSTVLRVSSEVKLSPGTSSRRSPRRPWPSSLSAPAWCWSPT